MASSAVSFMVKTLGTLIQNEVVMLWGVEEDLKILSSTLSTILAVLDDAELKQYKNKLIQDWLRKIKDAAYVVSDILDECETEALKWEIKNQGSGSLKKVWTSVTAYPVVNFYFRHQIGSRMKDIIKDLNTIAEERKKFSLNEGLIGQGLALSDDSHETSSSLPPLELFGRRDDKEKIVKVLTKQVCDMEGFSVYPIIGMAGLGKTTLAQMVFNDARTNSHFEPKIWVYVSQNFNVKQLLKQIIESTPGEDCKATSLDPLQKEVSKRLSGKRYLLVLDDAWSENQEEWDKLKPALACGLPGACVVVTTRSENLASIVGTLRTHRLSPLSGDDCWLLFRQRAFGPSNEECPDLVDIGKDIVKKCAGVPLVAKALGGMLRFERGAKEWIAVNKSNLWDIPEEECSILPALRLSYYSLSLVLRRCFSYCAVFLKGSRIEKDKLIQMWIANGFISSKNMLEVEDVGNHVWNELYTRSFFQDKEKDRKGDIYFRMHDLMHDLSQFVMGDECQVMEAQTASTQRIRHATLIHSGLYGDFPEALKKQCSLHTILLQRRDGSDADSVFSRYSWGLKSLGSLRVLDASNSRMTKFSGSGGYSKHLRYLNLSGSYFRELPASICGLLNLQTLNLNRCILLRRLPKKMNKFVGLRHLYLLGCTSLKDTPAELGKLTQLKTLSLFVVGEKNGRRLGELKHLDLGGEIEIKHLERVTNSMDAKDANLAGKPNIRILILSWDEYSSENSVERQQVAEALVPHPNIEDLTISHYSGTEFPLWMGNTLVLKNVVRIELNDCNLCRRLPALGQLPCLKVLCIEYVSELVCLMVIQKGNKFTTEGGDGDNNVTSVAGGFPSLEILVIRYLLHLKEVASLDGEEEEEEEEDEEDKEVQQRQQQQHKLVLLPRLKTLVIERCPQFTLPTLYALESLSIYTSIDMNMVNWMSKLTGLTSLVLRNNYDLVCFPDEMFRSLTRLQTLEISGFSKLGTLPESIRSLTQLRSLHIWRCPPELKKRCENGSGEDWYKIAHIPDIRIISRWLDLI